MTISVLNEQRTPKMNKISTERKRVSLNESYERERTWKGLIDDERNELFPPSQRRALGFGLFLWWRKYVPSSVAAAMLGVSIGEFRKLCREYADEIGQSDIGGRRLYLTRDILLIKAGLRGSDSGVK
jgi:hypothetical protein